MNNHCLDKLLILFQPLFPKIKVEGGCLLIWLTLASPALQLEQLLLNYYKNSIEI